MLTARLRRPSRQNKWTRAQSARIRFGSALLDVAVAGVEAGRATRGDHRRVAVVDVDRGRAATTENVPPLSH